MERRFAAENCRYAEVHRPAPYPTVQDEQTPAKDLDVSAWLLNRLDCEATVVPKGRTKILVVFEAVQGNFVPSG